MNYHVMNAQYVSGYTIRVAFRDGSEGEIDFAGELDGPVFEPLKDVEQFKCFYVDPEFHTLVWPNGADFAPEFLYGEVRVPA